MNTPSQIKGYEGLYEIDQDGNVFSLWNRGRKTKRLQPKKIAHLNNGNGYFYVILCKNKHKKNHYVHRLIAENFISGFGRDVAHKDGDRSNNKVGNLMWCSHKENESHKKLHGTFLYGNKAPWSKLTESDVRQIYLERGAGSMVKDIAKRFKVCPTAISAIFNGKNWKHVLSSN